MAACRRGSRSWKNPQEEDVPERKQSAIVQKRIAELEKRAGGLIPSGIRAPSLGRPIDTFDNKYHEAERSNLGLKMPVSTAPLDGTSVSEVGNLESVGTSQGAVDKELSQESLKSEVTKPSTERTFPPVGPASHESNAQDSESRTVLQDEEGESAFRKLRSSFDKLSVNTGAHVAKAVDASPDSVVNGLRLENGTTVGYKSLPVSVSTETMADSETHLEIMENATTVQEYNLVHISSFMFKPEIGKEDELLYGPGEAYDVIPSADSVPQKVAIVPEELHSGAPADETKESGVKFEAGEAGILVELESVGTLETVAALQAHEGELPEAAEPWMLLPVTHQRSTVSEITEEIIPGGTPMADPLPINSWQDWDSREHSRRLTSRRSSGQKVRRSSAQDDAHRTPADAGLARRGITGNGNAQSDKYRRRTPLVSLLAQTPGGAEYWNGQSDSVSKIHRSRKLSSLLAEAPTSATSSNAKSDKLSEIKLRRTISGKARKSQILSSLLAEEDVKRRPDSGTLASVPQNESSKKNFFKRLFSGGKNSVPSSKLHQNSVSRTKLQQRNRS